MARIIYRLRIWLRQETPLLVLALLALVAVAARQVAAPPRRYHHGHASSRSWKRPPPTPAVALPRFFGEWRRRFLANNAATDRLGLVRGIFLGDDSAIPPDVSGRFRDAGLYHLLAASGFNCWIVAMMFGLAAKLALHFALPRIPAVFALRARIWIGPLASVAGAWLFWSWTDQAPPITRAAVMVSAKFLLEASGLSYCFGRLLLTQYLLSLIFLPRLWGSASFQLTFGCLFGVLIFPSWLKPWRDRIPEGLPARRWILLAWDSVASSTGACLGAAPTTWLYFGELNFTSVLTNGLATPFVTFALMPLGLLQMILLTPGTGAAGGWGAVPPGSAAAAVGAALDETLETAMRVIPSLRYVD